MTDTICALATAPGGAIAIIRVSGPDAITAVSSLCGSPITSYPANTVHFTRILSSRAKENGNKHPSIVDEVLVSIFRSPHSYTGEDSVEISCHGSRYILNNVMDLLIQQGCRMAQPGEFTKRAYLNGKLDLSQAEAVADLIASTNKATHELAMSQLRGGISSELGRLRERLLKLTSLLELELDFSDHEDLEFADRTTLTTIAEEIQSRVTRLAHSFETGKALKEGIPVAIVGKTNVGKSTLLNRLLKDDRAIVSDVHGTTRDTIEDTIDLHGVTFRFIDTAGIRQTTDEVEQIGIQRTYAAIEKARIVLWIFDTPPSESEIADITERTQGRSLIMVQNKIDKNNAFCPDNQNTPAIQCPLIRISAKHGQGLEELEAAIYEAAHLPTLSDTDIIISNARHYEALIKSAESLHRVIAGLQANLSGDLIAEDLRIVLSDLAEITGQSQITPNEVLSNIFKHFCIGK